MDHKLRKHTIQLAALWNKTTPCKTCSLKNLSLQDTLEKFCLPLTLLSKRSKAGKAEKSHLFPQQSTQGSTASSNTGFPFPVHFMPFIWYKRPSIPCTSPGPRILLADTHLLKADGEPDAAKIRSQMFWTRSHYQSFSLAKASMEHNWDCSQTLGPRQLALQWSCTKRQTDRQISTYNSG